MSSLEKIVKKAALKEFDLVGIAEAGLSPFIDHYAAWIQKGQNGDMKYLERHLEKKRNPQLMLAGAKSWISMASYYDTQEVLSVDISEKLMSQGQGWVSRYARGRDYHHWIEEKHSRVINELMGLFPEDRFLSCVDSKAVLERDAASRAGLGWIGKNTCLINKDIGSFIFLSEILTTLELKPDKPVLDHCGTCRRCLDACPTGALTMPKNLDARLCISYWTIESKSLAPQELSKKFGVHIYGCDICQDVCPWNQKARKKEGLPSPRNEDLFTFDLRSPLSLKDLEVQIKDTAMERAGAKKILENAAVALQNLNMKNFIFKSLKIGPEKNFAYFLLCKKTGEGAVFDGAFEADKIWQWTTDIAKELGLQLHMKYLVATHGHWDHAGGFPELLKYFPEAQIACHREDEKRLVQQKMRVHLKFQDNDIFNVGDISVQVLHSPGHTEGGACYLVDDFILTGDTLFIDQCGRTDLPGGDEEMLFKSLQRIKALPDLLTVFPGHDYGPKPFAKLSEQKITNPALRAKNFEEFQKIP